VLDGGIAGRGVLSHYNKRLSIIQVGSDDMIIISGINRSGVFGRVYDITKVISGVVFAALGLAPTASGKVQARASRCFQRL
jgi:hypothetical protein